MAADLDVSNGIVACAFAVGACIVTLISGAGRQ
jgi:hypothetical protein